MMDDRRYRGDLGTTLCGHGASALPGFTRLSEAEARDLRLVIAPERLAKSRRRLQAMIEPRTPSNGNRA
jgi:hypothetical protein